MPVDDADLARLLHRHLADLLSWLDDYPADQVDPARRGLCPAKRRPGA